MINEGFEVICPVCNKGYVARYRTWQAGEVGHICHGDNNSRATKCNAIRLALSKMRKSK